MKSGAIAWRPKTSAARSTETSWFLARPDAFCSDASSDATAASSTFYPPALAAGRAS